MIRIDHNFTDSYENRTTVVCEAGYRHSDHLSAWLESSLYFLFLVASQVENYWFENVRARLKATALGVNSNKG